MSRLLCHTKYMKVYSLAILFIVAAKYTSKIIEGNHV